jgi:hypothetical protein
MPSLLAELINTVWYRRLFSRDGSQLFNPGEVDDLRIYNQALSAAEIQQLYQSGSASLVSIAVTPTNPSIGKGTTQQF